MNSQTNVRHGHATIAGGIKFLRNQKTRIHLLPPKTIPTKGVDMAGLLADVFSFGDTAKRKVKGLLADPVGTLQQFVGNENDRAGQFNELTSQATDERVNRMKTGGSMGVSEQRLAGLLADAYNPMGMVVWHGSPHKFAKFDSSKIGTGEGAQAYGHGLYLAESPEVAGQYKTSLQDSALTINGRPIKNQSGGALDSADLENFIGKDANLSSLGTTYTALAVRNQPNKKAAINALTERVLSAPDDATAKQLQAGVDYLQRANLDYGGSGQMYKVDLPDEHIAKMLDWDKPLSQQAPEVKAAFSNSDLKYGLLQGRKPILDPTDAYNKGEDAYRALSMEVNGGRSVRRGSTAIDYSDKKAAEYLNSLGIPGIRYLDGGSRGATGGTSNFVVFPGNEGLLSILERNGAPLK